MFTATLAANYSHVWSGDPALDTSKDSGLDLKLFHATGYRKHLPCKTGMEPMVWELQHLRGDDAACARGLASKAVDDVEYADMALKQIASLALMGVENALIDGEPFEIRRGLHRKSRTMRVTDDCMATIYAVSVLVNDLGNRVIEEDLAGDPT